MSSLNLDAMLNPDTRAIYKGVVVRVSTTYYTTKRGLATTKRIEFLKRKSDRDCVFSDRASLLAK